MGGEVIASSFLWTPRDRCEDGRYGIARRKGVFQPRLEMILFPASVVHGRMLAFPARHFPDRTASPSGHNRDQTPLNKRGHDPLRCLQALWSTHARDVGGTRRPGLRTSEP